MSYTIKKGNHDISYFDYKESPGETSITIPKDVNTLFRHAFVDCRTLKQIIIPESVTNILNSAFYDCTALEEIKVNALNPVYASRDGILYNKSFSELICHPGSRKSIHISDKIKKIAPSAFSGNKFLINIDVSHFHSHFIMHDGVLYTKDMKKLVCCPRDRKSIIIPDTVTEISSYAFEYCEALTDVIFPANLEKICENAFQHCINLKNITFPQGLKSIGDSAFQRCHSLKQIIIPEGTEGIAEYAFAQCAALESVIIPESVKRVGHLFQGRGNLHHVICHGIDIQYFYDLKHRHIISGNADVICNEYELTNIFRYAVFMICWRKFNLCDIPLELKYDILLQLYIRHPHEKEISDAVQKYVTEICQHQMQRISPEKFSMILDSVRHFITKQNLSDLIIYANEQKNYEMQIMLTEYKNKYIGYELTEERINRLAL